MVDMKVQTDDFGIPREAFLFKNATHHQKSGFLNYTPPNMGNELTKRLIWLDMLLKLGLYEQEQAPQ